MKKLFNKKPLEFLLNILLAATIFLVVVPFYSTMPGDGLDPSWQLWLNEAVSKKLRFGSDVIFTFGPYSSLFTKNYHPATDSLIILTGILFAIGYIFAIFNYAKPIRSGYSIILLIFFGAFLILRDVLLFSYPLLVLLNILGIRDSTVKTTSLSNSLYTKYAVHISLLFSVLALVTLVKVSVLPLVLLVLIISIFVLMRSKCPWLALIPPILFFIPLTILWVISGQCILDLPIFFINSFPIVYGYTEAMSSSGPVVHIIEYCLICIFFLLSIYKSESLLKSVRLSLIGIAVFFLFLSFKAGFVRHDGHALVASGFLFFNVLIYAIKYKYNHRNIIIFISFLFLLQIYSKYWNHINLYENWVNNYKFSLSGAADRLFRLGTLNNNYNKSLSDIREASSLPSLKGSADIYAYNQSALIASKNDWNPRPIAQSYSSYTPSLSYLNREHLLGYDSPDNIFFRVESIDKRFPSLDDGSSWPIFFERYEFFSESNYLVLKKKQDKNNFSGLSVLEKSTFSIGQRIPVPNSEKLIFVRVEISHTFFGKILNFLFKPNMLKIKVILKNGDKKEYRLVSTMAKSNFLISPLVENNKDFLSIYKHQENWTCVDYFVIDTYSKNLSWNSNFEVTFTNVSVP